MKPAEPAVVAAPALPTVRAMDGERAIAGVLRMGALLAFACFSASLLVEAVATSGAYAAQADSLRAAGASLLIVTPVVRLVVAGVALGFRGEYRYSAYAVAILALMATAASVGIAR